MEQPTYDSVILAGDRVALAPHLDLWMAGIRFGTVERTQTVLNGKGQIRNILHVRTDDLRTHVLGSEDTLGAVRTLMTGLDDCPWYDVPEGKRPWLWAHGDCGGRMLEDAMGPLCERHWNAFNLAEQ